MSSPQEKAISDQNGFVGIVTIRNYAIEGDRAREIDAFLKTANQEGGPSITAERFLELQNELISLCRMTKEVVKKNLVVLSGRAVFARRMIGDNTYSGEVTHGLLGTSNTAPASGNTALGAEVARKRFARRSRTNAQVNFDFYYSQSDTDGTYEEFGLSIDGTDTANTGQLFNRVLTSGWTKTDTEAMTVSVQVNVNAS